MGKLGKAQKTERLQKARAQITLAAAPDLVVKTKRKAGKSTYEGGTGFEYKKKGELYLLAVTNMVGEDTFYEGADARDSRFAELVHAVTAKDPDWVARFVPYLRDTMNMRSASIVMAAESALMRITHKHADAETTTRQLVSSALKRADEPGEFVAYWLSRTGSRTLPGGVQRGVADAVKRLYNQHSALKWDGTNQAWRMGDVIELVHPKASSQTQADLYEYLLDRRHHSDNVDYRIGERPEAKGPYARRAEAGLLVISAHNRWKAVPAASRRDFLAGMTPESINAAGFSWETLSSWLNGPLDATFWEKIIPSMGYMALMRNLRNFEEAGISQQAVQLVTKRLTDPEEVAKSRQFPLRFLSAYKAVNNLQWAHPLETALNESLQNVPSLQGKSLILIDRSASMKRAFSDRSQLQYWESGALFGMCLALRAEQPTLVVFGTSSQEIKVPKGGSILNAVKAMGGANQGGTNTEAAIRMHYDRHDRVIILTDEQASFDGPRVGEFLPPETWMHTFNIAGYGRGHAPAGRGRRHSFGGLTDRAFQALPMLEQGQSQSWPF